MNKQKLKKAVLAIIEQANQEKQARIILGDACFQNQEDEEAKKAKKARALSKMKKRLKQMAKRLQRLEQVSGLCVSNDNFAENFDFPFWES